MPVDAGKLFGDTVEHRRPMGLSTRLLGQAQPRLATESHRRATATAVESSPDAVARGGANLRLLAGDLGARCSLVGAHRAIKVGIYPIRGNLVMDAHDEAAALPRSPSS